MCYAMRKICGLYAQKIRMLCLEYKKGMYKKIESQSIRL